MTDLWNGVEALLERAESASPVDVTAHGIHLLAARHQRERGRPVPADWLVAERAAAVRAITFPALLNRVRTALDGPVILLKGPEIACRYPDPALRAFGDLDLLVPDAALAQRTLVQAGFVELADYEIPHQQHPLRWPGMPLLLEIHNYPSWLRWMTPPSNRELFEMAVPSATGVPGIATLPRPEHALLLAAHSWRHSPLRRLVDLIDVAIMADETDPDHLGWLAQRWGLGPVWATTNDAIRALFVDPSATTWPLKTWAKHLVAIRDRTVMEKHVTAWIGGLWAPTPRAKVRATVSLIAEDLRPLRGEPWSDKLARMGRAARDAFDRASMRTRSR